jgi:hypothetical protein
MAPSIFLFVIDVWKCLLPLFVIIRRAVDYLEDGGTKILILKNFVVLFESSQRDAATSVIKPKFFIIFTIMM